MGVGRSINNHSLCANLMEKTCTCRYWQLSGLPCCHAISCIFYKTNCLDDYVADCFSIEHFKRTYEYCLQPVEGMSAWQLSDKPRSKAPGYVKMPGRPKKCRKREPGETSKRKRMSKAGTRVRCSRCKGLGHNAITCERRNGPVSQPAGNAPAASQGEGRGASSPPANNAMVIVHTSQQSAASGTKRQRGASTDILMSSQSHGSVNRMNRGRSSGATTSAKAKVQTLPGGTATIHLEANVPTSQACSRVDVTVTSGTASAQVQAREPQSKKLTPRRPTKNHNTLLGV